MCTDVEDRRQYTMVELAFGGLARDLVRMIPMQMNVFGATSTFGGGPPMQYNGVGVILGFLNHQFGNMDDELSQTDLGRTRTFHQSTR